MGGICTCIGKLARWTGMADMADMADMPDSNDAAHWIVDVLHHDTYMHDMGLG